MIKHLVATQADHMSILPSREEVASIEVLLNLTLACNRAPEAYATRLEYVQERIQQRFRSLEDLRSDGRAARRVTP